MNSVILLEWGGDRWIPAGPDNGRRCMFSSKQSAMVWAKGATNPLCYEAWRFTTIELPPAPQGKD